MFRSAAPYPAGGAAQVFQGDDLPGEFTPCQAEQHPRSDRRAVELPRQGVTVEGEDHGDAGERDLAEADRPPLSSRTEGASRWSGRRAALAAANL